MRLWAVQTKESIVMNFKIVMDTVNQLTEEQAKQLLMEIMTAKSYSNQELIQKVQDIIERMEGVQ